MAVRRIKNHGKWVWQARVAYAGLRKATFRATKDEARDAEGELRSELKARAGQEEQEAQRPATLRQLLEFYALDMRARGKGEESVGRVEYTARTMRETLPALLDKPVSAIVDADVFAFRTARAQAGTKPSTINRDLRTLRAALKKARPEYHFPGGAFFPEDETRVRWLRPEEELLVLEPMPSPFRAIATLAALTLMRMTEIRTLRREAVHLEQGVVMLPRAKAGARPVILSTAARKVLQAELEAHPGAELVFPGPRGRPYSREQIGKAFRRAARAAGLRDFRFHDLRHHGATMALNRGFTAPIVMALGGWKTERMMRRYAAVTDQTLRAAAEAVSGTETQAHWSCGGPAMNGVTAPAKTHNIQSDFRVPSTSEWGYVNEPIRACASASPTLP
jgi:integrase